MARSAHYEGGLNTITRVFPVGADGDVLVGIMPKNGKISRVRFHGTADETDLSAQVFVRDLTGANPTAITTVTDLDAVFNDAATAHAGVEAVLQNQAARDAKDTQAVTLAITSAVGSVGELGVVVNFEPR